MSDQHPITPVLVYADIEAAHDFLVSAFGLQAGGVSRDPDGNVVHGEVSAGGAPIWMHRVSTDHGLAPAGSAQLAAGGLVVDVPHVDDHHARALAAGATVTGPPADRPYGRREYEARDPEGHRWWFGTPLG